MLQVGAEVVRASMTTTCCVRDLYHSIMLQLVEVHALVGMRQRVLSA